MQLRFFLMNTMLTNAFNLRELYVHDNFTESYKNSLLPKAHPQLERCI